MDHNKKVASDKSISSAGLRTGQASNAWDVISSRSKFLTMSSHIQKSEH